MKPTNLEALPGGAVPPPREKNSSIAIRQSLHQLLRQKAKAEGRILQAMVEDKLAELVAAQPLSLGK